MKKLTLSAMLLATLSTGTFNVLAEDNSVTHSEDGTGAKSHAHMTLVPGDDSTDPTEPLDPSDPNGETGNTGPLTIDYITPLEFGEHHISGGSTIYTTVSEKPNVQITDNRGEGKGWSLQVTSSPFVDSTDNKKILKGAVLTLPEGNMKTTIGNISTPPKSKEVVLSTDKESTDTLMTADENSGMGTWENLLDASKVTVNVPAGNFAGDYTSTLTWTLLDTPNV